MIDFILNKYPKQLGFLFLLFTELAPLDAGTGQRAAVAVHSPAAPFLFPGAPVRAAGRAGGPVPAGAGGGDDEVGPVAALVQRAAGVLRALHLPGQQGQRAVVGAVGAVRPSSRVRKRHTHVRLPAMIGVITTKTPGETN